ncbi:nicotinamide riboside transporter PnuC [Wenzhouxiangella sp. EGI_FJ10305]|uniref:nicotinamide riboside transporter PnuC n=1 Tax=Wenzhouxiangella sp. EGI_FJ10305 TaxID=3243768 RepID=UPI0035DD53CD
MIPESWLEQIAERWAAMSGWELAAVVLAVAYLLLAVRQNRLCWIAAFVSTAIFTVLFWNVQLLMQSALNGYYMIMAVYGWWNWRHGQGSDGALPITRWPLSRHALALGVIAACALVSGYLLTRYSQAAWPWLDSFVTWGAVVTTFMVARKVLENWSYWMVINSLAIFLFIDRGMQLTALLHATYLIISVFGWISWHRDYRRQESTAHETRA